MAYSVQTKMRFGFHVSIAGGLAKAADAAVAAGCEALQIFSRNPRGWSSKALDPGDIKIFLAALGRHSLHPLVVHMPYLPNLASSDTALYEKSAAVLYDELRRAESLGARFLVTHVGHSGRGTVEEALSRVARAVTRACRDFSGSCMLLLENTAGQGTEIGSSFGQLKTIIDLAGCSRSTGICLDTAHAFAAGYNLATGRGLEAMIEELDRTVGLERLRLLHLNDSKAGPGSRVDRHWHIGQGSIGREAFRRIIRHGALSRLPAIMETPKKTDADDLMNMRTVRRLRDADCKKTKGPQRDPRRTKA